jgi:uncharacterized protein (TIGR03083 family)
MASEVTWNEIVGAIDVGAAYRGVRERITELLTGIDEATWEQAVPHCPEWTVRQTLAHLVGVVDDAVNNNLAGAGTDEWTKVQVDKRADTTGAQLLNDWTSYGPFVEARFTQIGLAGAQGVFDAATHEHDLRHALGYPGARTSDALKVAVEFIRTRLAEKANVNLVVTDEAGGIRVAADSFAQDGPTGPTTLMPITLTATMFDVVRTFSSRRSEAEIRQLHWSTDPAPVFGHLPFALPKSALSE